MSSKRLDIDIVLVPTVVVTCCTLHNICEKHNETYGEDLPAASLSEATGEDGDQVGALDNIESSGGIDPAFCYTALKMAIR